MMSSTTSKAILIQSMFITYLLSRLGPRILIVVGILFLCIRDGRAQTIGGYSLVDYLASAVHPNGCNDSPVTTMPDNTTWVNLKNNDVATGLFNWGWMNGPNPDELILHTSYHRDNYTVRLELQGGGYSSSHTVVTSDWTSLSSIGWNYTARSCGSGFSASNNQYILPLDFDADFGVTGAQTVIGIEITFKTTSGKPDLAGVYITNNAITTPLSVDLVSFEADPINCDAVKLSWVTSSEINNDYFTIEKGTDAVNFEPIAKVNGNGNSNTIINYSWIDDTPIANEIAYYRLKQTDYDGAFKYHKVIAVTCEQSMVTSIFPNPFENSFTILLSENNTYPTTIEVIDHLGRKVYTQLTESARTEIALDEQIAAGIYFIRVYNENTQVVERIVKK